MHASFASTQAKTALIVVDVQNGFIDGGGLPVKGGAEVVPVINRLASVFENIVITQDWHPPSHASFAINHAGRNPYDMATMPYGEQVLWPVHCVQGTWGAKFHADLQTDPAHLVIRKGFRAAIDSYSALFENDRLTPTGLAGYLAERGVAKLTLVGLATDYCVAFSALDGAKGFSVTVLEGACRAIDLGGSLAAQQAAMRAAGVTLLD